MKKKRGPILSQRFIIQKFPFLEPLETAFTAFESVDQPSVDKGFINLIERNEEVSLTWVY